MPEVDTTLEYRNIPDWPGYKAGSDGTVWSRWGKIGLGYGGGTRYVLGEDWRCLKGCQARGGYLKVTLCPGRKTRFVHQLILEAFVGPRPKGTVGRHFPDPCRKNNAISNLQWGTHKQNQADRITHGTDARGEKSHLAKFTREQVLSIRAEHRTLPRMGALIFLAKKHSISRNTIKKIVHRHTWKHI